MKRSIQFYGQKILDFFDTLDQQTAEKIEWTLGLVRNLERIPNKYFKHLTGTNGLYEIRLRGWEMQSGCFVFLIKEK